MLLESTSKLSNFKTNKTSPNLHFQEVIIKRIKYYIREIFQSSSTLILYSYYVFVVVFYLIVNKENKVRRGEGMKERGRDREREISPLIKVKSSFGTSLLTPSNTITRGAPCSFFLLFLGSPPAPPLSTRNQHPYPLPASRFALALSNWISGREKRVRRRRRRLPWQR